ncbi:YhcN/YlaJ family sporulation lipoprotein [Alkalibaculum bacchi]|mgnify:FL=1|uniref:YhcN/YlaJ family sporulation lipoprotein n=1 Tax=Alkalibaculum bacchi TaxID=645887 RepID=UPI0026EC5181|nr:YhcN/YlaJ family sporulation lipoprotein [Alkalibaculum bacchi]
MNKKFITVVTIVSLVALLGVGCTTNTDDATKNNTTRNNSYGEGMYNVDDSNINGRQRDFVNQYDTNSNYDGLGNSNGIDEMVRNNGASNYNYRTYNNGNTNNNGTNNNYRNSALGDSNLTNRIEEICNRKDEVDDSTVVINDDTCYVGLDLDKDQLSEKTKETLSNEIKREDPSITKVYFTKDRDKIEEFIDDIGNTINVDWNKLENVFR